MTLLKILRSFSQQAKSFMKQGLDKKLDIDRVTTNINAGGGQSSIRGRRLAIKIISQYKRPEFSKYARASPCLF